MYRLKFSRFGILFYIPLFYQGVFDLNATQSGVRLLPGIVASVTGSLLSGLIMQRSGKVRLRFSCACTRY
jgi:hypothetical protein